MMKGDINMKMLDILQSEDFECMYSLKENSIENWSEEDFQRLFNTVNCTWKDLYNTFSDEQKALAKCFNDASEVTLMLLRRREFRRGFKIATKIMMESLD